MDATRPVSPRRNSRHTMPASFIAELILQPVFEFILHIVLYYIGRVAVAVLTLGRIKCDRISADTPRRKLRWSGLFHRRGQHVYLTPESTSGAGFLFVVFMLAGLLLFHGFRD